MSLVGGCCRFWRTVNEEKAGSKDKLRFYYLLFACNHELICLHGLYFISGAVDLEDWGVFVLSFD